ncbi:TrmH family RNA methyltransferase [Maribacter chungangensis]|uniref:TrmH family RNA methyltransferase n=1 Tax=Maribacter chungangensis TaxID=1069117 RepID=A0ABW3B864_9FLAO
MKLIKSLHQKKYRNEHGLFVIEGRKGLEELFSSSIKPYKVYTTGAVELNVKYDDIQLVSARELKQMSALKNPNGAIGAFHIPTPKSIDFEDWILLLDEIQDPGNLGTIIRLCDWFGITNLVCSKNTVDCYNPKVLQATMGSIARVNVLYTNIVTFLNSCPLPVYGSFMDGVSVHETELPKKGILVMGNEGNGISLNVKKLCNHHIAVPQYGKGTTESLNVGTASAILLNEVRRQG